MLSTLLVERLSWIAALEQEQANLSSEADPLSIKFDVVFGNSEIPEYVMNIFLNVSQLREQLIQANFEKLIRLMIKRESSFNEI